MSYNLCLSVCHTALLPRARDLQAEGDARTVAGAVFAYTVLAGRGAAAAIWAAGPSETREDYRETCGFVVVVKPLREER